MMNGITDAIETSKTTFTPPTRSRPLLYDPTGTANSPTEFIAEIAGPVYLGTILFCLVVGSTGTFLNLVVISFCRRATSLVQLLYLVLSSSDLATSLCALLHSVTFLCLYLNPDMTTAVSVVAYSAYFVSIISFRLSAFVSLTIEIVRTIHLHSPFYVVSKKRIVYATLIYSLILGVISSIELSTLAGEKQEYSGWLFIKYFLQPSKLKVIQDFRPELKCITGACDDPCFLLNIVNLVPIILPVLLMALSCATQLCLISKMKALPQGHEDNLRSSASITITIITIAYLISSTGIAYPFVEQCTDLDLDIRTKYLLHYYAGYSLFFLNGAINPVILICRGDNLKRYFVSLVPRVPHTGTDTGRSGRTRYENFMAESPI